MFVDVEHRLRHRDVDAVAECRVLTLVERGDHRNGAFHRGIHVGMAVRIVRVLAVTGVAL